jgi:hypothetical protein
MNSTTETLKITWKFIRRKGYGRTPATYCSYVAENEKHKHRLKTVEGTKLFKLLQDTRIARKPNHPAYASSILIDISYCGDKVISITNPRVCNYKTKMCNKV